MESASFTTLSPEVLVDVLPDGVADAAPAYAVPRGVRRIVEAFGGPWARTSALAGFDLLAAVALCGLLEGKLTARIMLIALVSLLALGCSGAYGPRWRDELPLSARLTRLSLAAVVSLWLGSALASVYRPQDSLDGLLAATVALPTTWVLTRSVANTWFKAKPVRILVAGSARAVDGFVSAPVAGDSAAPRLVGYVSDGSEAELSLDPRSRLGALNDIGDVLARVPVDRVVVVGSHRLPSETVLAILRACDLVGVEVDIASPALAGAPARARVSFYRGLPLLRVRERRTDGWQWAVKRSIDVLGASAACVILFPLFAAVAMLALIAQGRPIFFRQKRVGLNGREFEILKFRTMSTDAEERTRSYTTAVQMGSCPIAHAVSGLKDAAQAHVTPLGAVLRKTSLDELPQLWNVLRGDMSLVGPRPLRQFEHETLEPWIASQRATVRPGITGLWQVRGRSDVDWHERINLDYSQVRNWNLSRDAEILAETVPALLKGR